MKHLVKYEDFAYHSEISEEKEKNTRTKKEIERQEIQSKKKQIKPGYSPTLKEIPRLM